MGDLLTAINFWMLSSTSSGSEWVHQAVPAWLGTLPLPSFHHSKTYFCTITTPKEIFERALAGKSPQLNVGLSTMSDANESRARTSRVFEAMSTASIASSIGSADSSLDKITIRHRCWTETKNSSHISCPYPSVLSQGSPAMNLFEVIQSVLVKAPQLSAYKILP